MPGGVAGINHDGQMAQAANHGNRTQVKSVAGAGLEGTDAALAKNNFVPTGQNVFGRHQELFNGSGQNCA